MPVRSSSSSGRRIAGEAHDVALARTMPARRAVVLVGDLADDLLDEVLERRDAGGAAVLVDHDGHLVAAAAQLAEEHVELHGLGHAQRLGLQRGRRDLGAPLARHRDGLLHVHEPDDVVDGSRRTRGSGEYPVGGRAGSRPRPSPGAARAATRGRGVMTSAASWSAKRRVRPSSVAVSCSSSAGARRAAHEEDSSSAVRAPESSSFGSMPTPRRSAFALPLSSDDRRAEHRR